MSEIRATFRSPGHGAGIHYGWIILAVCFVDLFINYSVRLGYGVVLPEMIRSLGIGRAAGGSIYNSSLFTYIALTPLAGYLTDRFGARRVITICLSILGSGVLFLATAESLATACVAFAVVGLGATGLWVPVITLAQRWFAFHRRGLALGILSTGYGLGFATMGVVFPWVVHQFNWRYAWYFLGAAAIVMIVVNALLLRSDPETCGLRPWGDRQSAISTPRGNDSVSRPTSEVNPFKTCRFWLIGFSYFAIAYSLYGITTFMVDYAKSQLGLSLEEASLLATVHGFGQIGGVLTVLPLSDYLGRKKTIMISNGGIMVALLGVVWIARSWTALGLLIAALAVFYGATFPIYGACAGDYFAKDSMGTVMGAWTPFYGAGAISTHWVTGALRDATGVYDQSFLISAAMALVALLLMGRVRQDA